MGARLGDKVAIVTGAGSIGPGWGNGKATAVLFTVDISSAVAEETKGIIDGEACTSSARTGGTTTSWRLTKS